MEIKLYVTTIYPSRNKKAINIFDFIISHCNSITASLTLAPPLPPRDIFTFYTVVFA